MARMFSVPFPRFVCVSTDNAFDFILSQLWNLFYIGPLPFQRIFNQMNLSQADYSKAAETSEGLSVETGCT